MRATMLHNMHDHASLFSSQRYTAAGCWSVLIAPQPSPPQQSFATLVGALYSSAAARRHNGLAVPCIGRPRPAVSTSIRTVPLGSSVVFLIHHQPLQDDCKENDAVTGWSLSITCTQWRSFNFRFSHPGFADRCWRALAAGTIDVDLDLDEEWMT